MEFKELNLRPSSLKAIEAMGFTTATEIQEKSIPILLAGETDYIGQAQTGTGKTAAFVLPLVEKLDRKSKSIQSMIIAPTRELANQICDEIAKLTQFEPVSTVCVYGGASVSGQIKDIRFKKPQIIVGTPGRLIDFIDRRVLNLEDCKTVILDEADEMLDMGFFEDVKLILSTVKTEKRIWMFSATMPGPILELVREHFCNPTLVKVTKQILTADAVTQQFVLVRESNRTEALCRMLDKNQDMYAIVFCRTKLGVDELSGELNARGYLTDSLHGDMSQDQRDLTMRRFKEKKATLLICTDVAARGIDVNDLTHVINFSLPQDNESYVHRIGRTGRGGKTGIALSIISPDEQGRIRQIERITKAKIEKILLPTVEEIVEVLMNKAQLRVNELMTQFNASEDKNFENFKTKFATSTTDDLLKALYAFMFEQNLKRYKKAQSIDIVPEANRRNPSDVNTQGIERIYLNVGKTDGLNVKELISYLCGAFRVRGSDIGRIDLKDRFTFFEIKGRYARDLIELKGEYFGDREISFQLASSDNGGGNRGAKEGGFRGNYRSNSRPSPSNYAH